MFVTTASRSMSEQGEKKTFSFSLCVLKMAMQYPLPQIRKWILFQMYSTHFLNEIKTNESSSPESYSTTLFGLILA